MYHWCTAFSQSSRSGERGGQPRCCHDGRLACWMAPGARAHGHPWQQRQPARVVAAAARLEPAWAPPCLLTRPLFCCFDAAGNMPRGPKKHLKRLVSRLLPSAAAAARLVPSLLPPAGGRTLAHVLATVSDHCCAAASFVLQNAPKHWMLDKLGGIFVSAAASFGRRSRDAAAPRYQWSASCAGEERWQPVLWRQRVGIGS